MDNASYQNRQLQKSTSTKTELSKYFLERDTYFEFNYKKEEILEVLSIFNIKKQYVSDHLTEQKESSSET